MSIISRTTHTTPKGREVVVENTGYRLHAYSADRGSRLGDLWIGDSTDEGGEVHVPKLLKNVDKNVDRWEAERDTVGQYGDSAKRLAKRGSLPTNRDWSAAAGQRADVLAVEVGDSVWIRSVGRYRCGVVTKVGPKRVTALVYVESSRIFYHASRPKAEVFVVEQALR